MSAHPRGAEARHLARTLLASLEGYTAPVAVAALALATGDVVAHDEARRGFPIDLERVEAIALAALDGIEGAKP